MKSFAQTAETHAADDDTIRQAQVQLQKCALAIGAMSDELAWAKQIKEFSPDRRKRALSKVVTPLLDMGESVGAAEHKARATPQYRESLIELAGQYKDAAAVIEKADALRIQWDSARSLLSVERAKIGML